MSKTKLEIWYEMSRLLKETKEREAELRRELCEDFIGKTEMVNGRVTVKGTDVDSLLEYKAVQTLSFNIDQAVLGTIWPGMSDIEKAVFKMKPTLQLRPYKALPENSIVHESIIAKLAMPTLTIEFGRD